MELLFIAVPLINHSRLAFFNEIYKGPWTRDHVFIHVFGFPVSKIAKSWRVCQITLEPMFWEVPRVSVPVANLFVRVKLEMLSAKKQRGQDATSKDDNIGGLGNAE